MTPTADLGTPVRLLIVDDNEADRALYRRLLRGDTTVRYAIEEAETGEEGLAAIRGHAVDLVLLDFRLPDQSGIEVLDALNSGLEGELPPIIMLTGQGDETVAVEAMKRGAQDYVVKSTLTPERLRHAIRGAVEKARLRSELHARYRELEARNRELQDYASAIAHDLRSPLQAILLAAEIVLLQHGETLPTGAHRHLERLVNSATRMGRLLSDLLEYARAGVADRPPERIDLSAIVGEVVEDLGPVILQRKAVVEVGPLPEIVGHRALMRQLFQNLVGNALKFRGESDPVVKVFARRHGAAWEVTVADNGMGIEESQRESIFRVFHRGRGAENIEGTGIGLAICKKIMDQAEGSIRVESVVGAGSAFRVMFPASPAALAQIV